MFYDSSFLISYTISSLSLSLFSSSYTHFALLRSDIRRVIHWGVAKTMEEYYQQIGRAGRDGLPSQCYTFFNSNDFNKFRDPYWMKNVPENQRPQKLAALDTFQAFCESPSNCKRHDILTYFGEVPPYARCTTCGNCRRSNTELRDFTIPSIDILKAVDLCCTSSYKPSWGILWKKLDSIKRINRRGLKAYYKALLVPITFKGLLIREMTTGLVGDRNISWDTYRLSLSGKTALQSQTPNIMLPAPDTLLIEEKVQKEKVASRIQTYMDRNFDLSIVPAEELEAGSGSVLSTLSTWHSMLERYRKDERTVRLAANNEELHRRIVQWRSETAERSSLAPATIMRADLSYKIAYVKPTTEQDLHLIGVRSSGTSILAQLISTSLVELGLAPPESDATVTGAKMILPAGLFTPRPRPPYTPVMPKRTPKSLPNFVVSYQLFMQGQLPAAIAANGHKSVVKINTIINHLLYNLVDGKPLNLQRLWESLSKQDIILHQGIWEELEKVNQWEMLASPTLWNQGTGQKNFHLTPGIADQIMKSVNGGKLAEIADISYSDRDDEQKASYQRWSKAMQRWSLLKRCGVPITFEECTEGDGAKQEAGKKRPRS